MLFTCVARFLLARCERRRDKGKSGSAQSPWKKVRTTLARRFYLFNIRRTAVQCRRSGRKRLLIDWQARSGKAENDSIKNSARAENWPSESALNGSAFNIPPNAHFDFGQPSDVALRNEHKTCLEVIYLLALARPHTAATRSDTFSWLKF